MRKVKVSATTPLSENEAWEIVSDIKNWDRIVKFVRWVKLTGPVKEGTYFDDMTVILWKPIKISHKIVKVEKNKRLQMEAYMPLKSGIMHQLIIISRRDGITEVTVEISFKLNFLLDLLVGWLLEYRIREMIVGTLENVKRTKGVEGKIY